MEYNVNNGTLSTGDIATNQRTSIYQQVREKKTRFQID